jgi:cytochrome c-type biogenesis protein CcsB
VSAIEFAHISNITIMFAGIVYALAFLSHVIEWALSARPTAKAQRTAEVREAVAVAAGGASVEAEEDVARAVHPSERAELAGRIGISLTILATIFHAVAVVTRGLASDPIRVPWGNMYEFTMTATLGVSLIYLALLKRYGLRWLGAVVTLLQVVLLMVAGLLLYVPAGPLMPALHSYWLAIHVLAAILASGAFFVGAVTAALYLVKDRAERRGKVGLYLSRLPSSETLNVVSFRVNAIGFPIWTFAALITGPIWAEYAWGSYWNWDPKEVWAFITWVLYAAYLHARVTAGWKTQVAAVIALVAFSSLMWNFIGINFFFGAGSQHSYAGK